MTVTTVPAYRGNRRVIHPVDVDQIMDRSTNKLKNALDDDGASSSLPRTVSTSSGSTSSSTSSSTPSSPQQYSQDHHLYPITGRLSNVLDDYIVFPKVLGEGHYGCVRECIHKTTKRTLACKTVDKSKIGRMDHLQREVHLLSEMDHGGVMRMVDCYEDATYVHMVTERYTGGELFDKIVENTRHDGCYSEQKTAGIIKGLLEAVAYLHENEVVHRDIKPENILFEDEQEENIKLIDFGLSRRHARGEAPMSNPVGTAYYMAPELLKGRYDKSSDLWSVGTIVYILLAGYPPFNGESDPAIFESIKRGHFDFPLQQWSNTSDEAKDLIKCLLRRDPRKRFTAQEALMHPWIVNCGGSSSKRRKSGFRKF